MNRKKNIQKMQNDFFDVLVVGGGISGSAIAACLSAQPLKIALAEKNDFGSGTSQESSNLIWGGIKYLENFELGLVRKLCKSRNKLLKYFSNQVKEIRFLFLHEKKSKHPFWKVYLGAWFYWLWGNFFTSPPKRYSLQKKFSIPINHQKITNLLEYSDAYLPENDSRFVFNFIKQADKKGASVANYLELKKTRYHLTAPNSSGPFWEVTLFDKVSKKKVTLKTRFIVNAGGIKVDEINQTNKITTNYQHLFSKGVHVIVKKLFLEEKVIAFFSSDNRLFFAIPMGDKTCLGTTDNRLEKPLAKVTTEDKQFILDNINSLFKLKTPLTLKDVIATRCGIRPLVIKAQKKSATSSTQDWFSLSRKHLVEEHEKNYFSIFGGKLTDVINIAEEVSWKIIKKNKLNTLNPWVETSSKTNKKDFIETSKTTFEKNKKTKNSNSNANSEITFGLEKLWQRYGEDARAVIKEMVKTPTLLADASPDEHDKSNYSLGEINYLIKNEMVCHPEDILRRRTMLSLTLKKKNLNVISAYLKKKLTSKPKS